MCLNGGTYGKLMVLGVPVLKNFRVVFELSREFEFDFSGNFRNFKI